MPQYLYKAMSMPIFKLLEKKVIVLLKSRKHRETKMKFEHGPDNGRISIYPFHCSG